MANGKTVKLFLMDSDPNGRVKCSLANWTGVAYKVPRTMVDQCNGINYLKQSGVYFLFGTDSNDNPLVYVGQAVVRQNGEGLLCRIQEPHPTIDYWTEAVMFTTTNDSFGPTEVSYLENRFYHLALQAGRYTVKNSNNPNSGNVTEETECDLTEFVEYAKLVMGMLGHKVFEPYISTTEENDNEPIFVYNHTLGKAEGKRTREGFVVLKGSAIKPITIQSCPETTKRDRAKYADKISDDHLIGDVLLTSPSRAASFVAAASVSGNVAWKDANGNNPSEIDQSQ